MQPSFVNVTLPAICSNTATSSDQPAATKCFRSPSTVDLPEPEATVISSAESDASVTLAELANGTSTTRLGDSLGSASAVTGPSSAIPGSSFSGSDSASFFSSFSTSSAVRNSSMPRAIPSTLRSLSVSMSLAGLRKSNISSKSDLILLSVVAFHSLAPSRFRKNDSTSSSDPLESKDSCRFESAYCTRTASGGAGRSADMSSVL